MRPPYIANDFLPSTDSITRRFEQHSQHMKTRLYLDLLSTVQGLSVGGREPYTEVFSELRRIGPMIGIDVSDI
jgi:hypothetical protein